MDYSLGREEMFFCHQEALSTGLCVFHDENYSDDGERSKCLTAEIHRAMDNKRSLFCIGYNLPDIEFHGDFSKPVYFNHAKFQNVDFSNARFKEADFRNGLFQKKAVFSYAEFEKAMFYGVVFQDEVDFRRAVLNDSYFSDVVFQQNVDFAIAKFGETGFIGGRFHKEADFSHAVFDLAIFEGTRFMDEVIFFNVKFQREADFQHAAFESYTDFNSSTFQETANFTSAQFLEWTSFNKVLFVRSDRIFFDDTDLSKVSFMDSDITRIGFGTGVVWGGKDKSKVVEEVWLEEDSLEQNEPENTTLHMVLPIYRNLRENYEYNLRYEEAGRFFIREMELKRMYREKVVANRGITKRNGWFRRNFFPIGLYYHLGKYGEDYYKPTMWIVIVITASTLYWLYHFNPTLQPSFSHGGLMYLGQALERSVAAFFQFESKSWQDYVIRIVAIPILGTLFLALRRRFERRFRH